MKGYFTFLIVFAAFALLISLAELNLNSKTHNFSSAIKSERFYRAQMNVKEVLLEAARQGAQEGFGQYTEVERHTQLACYDPHTMSLCFNQNDARRRAEESARGNMERVMLLLQNEKFDDEIDVRVMCNGVDFSSMTCPDAVKTEVDPDPANPCGWRLSSATLTGDISIVLSSVHDPNLSVTVSLPSGWGEEY